MPGLLLPTASNVRPSYKSGFARSAAESSSPGLWDSLLGAWCSSLGPTGDTLHNVVHPGEDGVFTNMDPATDWTVSGDQGWVINSEDASEYVAITSPTLDNLVTVSGFTASVWVRVDALHGTSNAEATIFAKTVGGVWYSAWALIIDSDNLYWNISTTQPATESCNEAGFSAKHLGKWIHVVGVHDQLDSSSDQRLYVNGVEVGENYSAPSPSKNGSGLITLGGSEPLSTRFTLDGATANAMVWDRPLQPSEIRQLYRDPLAPFRQRRFTPTYSPVAEEAAATTSVGWTRSLTPSPVRPSYKSGFARSAAESSSPGLHDGMVVAYVPALGITGDTWHNVLSTTFPASPTQTRNEGVNKFGIHSGETGSGTNTISDCRTTLQGEATVMFVGQIGTSSVGSQRIFSIDSGAGFGDWAFIRNSSYNNGLLAVNWGWAGFVVTYAVSDNATGVWVARRTGTAGSWTAEIWEDGLLAAQTTGVTSNPTGGGTPACSIAGRDACKQLNALMAWNRALSDNEIRHLSKDIVAPFRQRRFTPTISGAAAAAEWQPYWGLHATRFAGILT